MLVIHASTYHTHTHKHTPTPAQCLTVPPPPPLKHTHIHTLICTGTNIHTPHTLIHTHTHTPVHTNHTCSHISQVQQYSSNESHCNSQNHHSQRRHNIQLTLNPLILCSPHPPLPQADCLICAVVKASALRVEDPAPGFESRL